jgi:hypothetical protein
MMYRLIIECRRRRSSACWFLSLKNYDFILEKRKSVANLIDCTGKQIQHMPLVHKLLCYLIVEFNSFVI